MFSSAREGRLSRWSAVRTDIGRAIISDVITTETRSKSLALVGIAFSICFTLGPSIGAYFASRPHPLGGAAEDRWNVYALPAAISLVLLLAETLYLAIRLPETRHWRKTGDAVEQRTAEKGSKEVKESVDSRLARLRAAGRLHGLFLLFFSGVRLFHRITKHADLLWPSSL